MKKKSRDTCVSQTMQDNQGTERKGELLVFNHNGEAIIQSARHLHFGCYLNEPTAERNSYPKYSTVILNRGTLL